MINDNHPGVVRGGGKISMHNKIPIPMIQNWKIAVLRRW